jgi:hypothetical protein
MLFIKKEKVKKNVVGLGGQSKGFYRNFSSFNWEKILQTEKKVLLPLFLRRIYNFAQMLTDSLYSAGMVPTRSCKETGK